MAVDWCDRCQKLVDLDWDVEHEEDHQREDAENERPEGGCRNCGASFVVESEDGEISTEWGHLSMTINGEQRIAAVCIPCFEAEVSAGRKTQ